MKYWNLASTIYSHADCLLAKSVNVSLVTNHPSIEKFPNTQITTPQRIMAAQIPTLKYFAFRGRALASRVALFNALGKEGWVDERVSLPRFKKAQPFPTSSADRTKAEYVTNNLPQLNLPCGLRVSQSHAIARYAAKLSPPAGETPVHFVPLYPSDPRQALLVDEAVAVVDQILLLTPKDEDAETKKRNREAFAKSGFLRVGMELLESRLKDSGGPFLLGTQVSFWILEEL